jgi:hypothetical protein
VFFWAYERSAARYAAIRQTTGDPDPFRLRHRQALKQVVAHVIREAMGRKEAAGHIASWTLDHIPETDRARFIEIAETELISIHDGNFARYQVRPSELSAWKTAWERRSTRKSVQRRLGRFASSQRPK